MDKKRERFVIYGAGGLGREVLQLVRDTKCLDGAEVAGFVDDGVELGTIRNDAPVLGSVDYFDTVTEPLSVVVGIADPRTKERLYTRLKTNPLLSFPSVVHPRALVRAYSTIEEGCVLIADCHISVNVRLGKCVLINDTATVGHDVTIGDFSSLMPQAAISGNIEIGARCLIGVGALVRQGLHIGADSVIGMGSVVLRDVPVGAKAWGNPARVQP
jgi:sugar O-acyltransferase (sialic acid O-acetyltransferase NeuD family)